MIMSQISGHSLKTSQRKYLRAVVSWSVVGRGLLHLSSLRTVVSYNDIQKGKTSLDIIYLLGGSTVGSRLLKLVSIQGIDPRPSGRASDFRLGLDYQ